jgi:aryl-alcohol dehydrogenase-like predicted oxidoreductase
MKYKSFFKGSIPVSEIGLGAWQLGINSGWQNMSEEEAIGLVEKSLEYGINFFDTAPNYGNGTSEQRLGKVLKSKDRSKIVINTKFGHTHTGTLNYSSDNIRESLEGSLRRLQVDYVDSLIIHNPPSSYLDGNNNDHYEILERLIDEGKIKAYGASLDTYEDMKLLMDTTNAKVIEAFFNILHQDTARGFEITKAREVGVIVKIPLDSGWLSGKYNAESSFNDIRSRWSKQDIETRAYLLNRVKEIIGTEGNLAQKAIAFCLAYDAVSTVIPGNVNIAQLTSNIQSTNIRISQEIVARLEKLYQSEIKDLNLPW